MIELFLFLPLTTGGDQPDNCRRGLHALVIAKICSCGRVSGTGACRDGANGCPEYRWSCAVCDTKPGRQTGVTYSNIIALRSGERVSRKSVIRAWRAVIENGCMKNVGAFFLDPGGGKNLIRASETPYVWTRRDVAGQRAIRLVMSIMMCEISVILKSSRLSSLSAVISTLLREYKLSLTLERVGFQFCYSDLEGKTTARV